MPRLTRKEFLRLAIAAAPLAALPRFAFGQTDSADAVRRERIADVFRMYHLLGSHRTATEPDNETAEWLTGEVSKRGAECTPRQFALDRVDLRAAFLEAGTARREGLPLFDGGFTSADGLRGRLAAFPGRAPRSCW